MSFEGRPTKEKIDNQPDYKTRFIAKLERKIGLLKYKLLDAEIFFNIIVIHLSFR